MLIQSQRAAKTRGSLVLLAVSLNSTCKEHSMNTIPVGEATELEVEVIIL